MKKMGNQRLLLLFFVLITLAEIKLAVADSGCRVCVLEPLLTSPIRCPICEPDYNECESEEELSLPYLDIYGTERNRRIDWRTCFVEVPPCNASHKYRSINGSCNNLNDETQGMRNTVFLRHLPANYEDGVHSMALGGNGQPKPLARALRTAFFPDRDSPDEVSLFAMQWGQVVAHDIAESTPSISFRDINCCLPPAIDNKEICLPIITPPNDSFYTQYNVTCKNIIRSNVTLIGNCDSCQQRQQYNNVSHEIDASLVYGSNQANANRLREFLGGRLRIQLTDNGRDFLPNLPPHMAQVECILPSTDHICYDAGDIRVVQNPQLAALQNVLLREHNRLADRLQQLRPEWDDETVYQKARAILVAIIQHITYKEWLELYIGKLNMVRYNLYPKSFGYTEYTGEVNVATINSVAAAALRATHSGIQGFPEMFNYQRQFQRVVPFSDFLDRPSIVQDSNNYDEFLIGLSTQPMQHFDHYFTEQITNLFFHVTKPFGFDLVSIDIERGRDHGLAPYIDYLEMCTGYHVSTFEELSQYIPRKQVRKLSEYYYSVQDIDLIVGGILERKVHGTRFGPTLVCLIMEQFYRKKWGDRFWYEVEGQPHTFTLDQLSEIRKVTLSRLLCDNSDNIEEIARNSFLPPSLSNNLIPCNNIPEINLNKWI